MQQLKKSQKGREKESILTHMGTTQWLALSKKMKFSVH